MTEGRLSYPRTLDCGGTGIKLALMAPQDDARVIAFANTLPEDDLLFMRRDIRQPKVVAAWSDLIAQGRLASLLAWSGEEVVGCAALIIDPLSWSPHVGELRVVVSRKMRGIGLGRVLIQEAFLIALSKSLEKLVVQMTVDQQGAIAVFPWRSADARPRQGRRRAQARYRAFEPRCRRVPGANGNVRGRRRLLDPGRNQCLIS
jgi:GNAT superfamily N-acetyltransferase